MSLCVRINQTAVYQILLLCRLSVREISSRRVRSHDRCRTRCVHWHRHQCGSYTDDAVGLHSSCWLVGYRPSSRALFLKEFLSTSPTHAGSKSRPPTSGSMKNGGQSNMVLWLWQRLWWNFSPKKLNGLLTLSGKLRESSAGQYSIVHSCSN